MAPRRHHLGRPPRIRGRLHWPLHRRAGRTGPGPWPGTPDRRDTAPRGLRHRPRRRRGATGELPPVRLHARPPQCPAVRRAEPAPRRGRSALRPAVRRPPRLRRRCRRLPPPRVPARLDRADLHASRRGGGPRRRAQRLWRRPRLPHRAQDRPALRRRSANSRKPSRRPRRPHAGPAPRPRHSSGQCRGGRPRPPASALPRRSRPPACGAAGRPSGTSAEPSASRPSNPDDGTPIARTVRRAGVGRRDGKAKASVAICGPGTEFRRPPCRNDPAGHPVTPGSGSGTPWAIEAAPIGPVRVRGGPIVDQTYFRQSCSSRKPSTSRILALE